MTRKKVDASDNSDEALMASYVAGDQQAFRQLFDRYAPQLARLFAAAGIAADRGRDLTQQTFLQLHRARNDFRAGAPFRPWLVTIANNLKRDFLRSKGRWHEVTYDPERQATPASQADRLQQHHRQQRLRAALAKLPSQQREVIEMHWFGDLSFGEIATALGIGKSLAKVRAHRGYKKLRSLLQEQNGSLQQGAL